MLFVNLFTPVLFPVQILQKKLIVQDLWRKQKNLIQDFYTKNHKI